MGPAPNQFLPVHPFEDSAGSPIDERLVLQEAQYPGNIAGIHPRFHGKGPDPGGRLPVDEYPE